MPRVTISSFYPHLSRVVIKKQLSIIIDKTLFIFKEMYEESGPPTLP